MIKIENMNYLLFQNLDNMVRNDVLKNRKIVLFGLNNTSYATKRYLEKRGVNVYAYIDNNVNKVNEFNRQFVDSLPDFLPEKKIEYIQKDIIRVYKPEDLLSSFDDDFLVLIASKYYADMCRQLQVMGYSEGKHIISTLDFYGIESILSNKNLCCGNILSKQEFRQVQLKIAVYLKKICKENNLRYFMSGGTLLGAVRHSGYIPWDDDMDFVMPMCDFLRLIELLKKLDEYDVCSNFAGQDESYIFYLQVCDRNTDLKLWNYPFFETCGVSIDVFPLVGFPKDKREMDKYFNELRYLNTRYNATFMYSQEDEEIIQNQKNLKKEIMASMQKYEFDSSEYVGYVLSKYWDKDIVGKNVYERNVELPFEDTSFNAPSGYISYLERMFGNYLEIPSEEQRKTTHSYVAYWKIH